MTNHPTADAARVDTILARYRDPVLDGVRAALDRPDLAHFRHLRQHFGWAGGDAGGEARNGKMLRPALCLLCCEATGGDASHALPAAVAIELLHNFTLIHDDIEDDSPTRHGRPALWREIGLAHAINAGDGMFSLAQRTLLRMSDAGVPPDRTLRAAATLFDACIALCEGQHLDLSFESRTSVTLAEYEAMIAGKTAALLGASAAIGAIGAGTDDATVDAFGRAGQALGLAFQVQDDLLGVWGDASATGKPVAGDIRARKKSFPVVWALEHAPTPVREQLARLYDGEMTGAAVDEVVFLLEEAGARAAATAAAESHAANALATLRSLPLVEDDRRDIEALAAFFVHRTS
ncbi:MAG: polyprenyl synthetase family protein [Dehalococcoidia bacterium]